MEMWVPGGYVRRSGFIRSRLRQVQEAEEGCLRIDVVADEELYFSDTYPMQVLAYNE